jgi:hypothetical protein
MKERSSSLRCWKDRYRATDGRVTLDPFVETHLSAAERSEVGNGVVVHRLYRSGPGSTARRALLVRFPAGSRWPRVGGCSLDIG